MTHFHATIIDVRTLIIIAALMSVNSAHADRLTDILLDHQKSLEFGQSLSKSMVIVAVSPKLDDWIDPQSAFERLGAAVAIQGNNGKIRLLTSGPLAQKWESLRVRFPSGRVETAATVTFLGDGALAEITVKGVNELVPLALADPKLVKRALPVFSVGNPGGHRPVLVQAVVVERLKEPVKGLIISDLKSALGWPLITADGTLAGINFRPHPKESGLTVGVGAEMIGAWLHPKSPKTNTRPNAH